MSRMAVSSDRNLLSDPRTADSVMRSQPPDDRFAVVSRLPLFAGIADERLADLASRTHWQAHEAGETVLDVGDTTNEVFVIAAGAVRVVQRTAFGYESILNDLSVGEYF